MKKILVFLLILCTAVLYGQKTEIVEDVDFTTVSGWQSIWEYLDSNYYRPYGEVKSGKDGMWVSTNGKRENLVQSKKGIKVSPNDIFEITADVYAEEATPVYLGILEYANGNLIKNDLSFVQAEKKLSTVKTIIKVTKGNNGEFDTGHVTFGVPRGKTAIIRSLKVKHFIPNDDQLAARLPQGVQLHFDASKPNCCKIVDGKVMEWRERSGKGSVFVAVSPEKAPVLILNAMNGRPVLRFDSTRQEEMKTKKRLSLLEGITIFAVFKREEGQGGGAAWQDILYWGKGETDNTGSTHLTLGSNANAEPAKVYTCSNRGGVVSQLTLGSNASKQNFMSGDVAEIIIYERELTHGECEAVRDYLYTKWNFSENDYVRLGPITEPVKRVTDAAPLSDQKNTGKWQLVESLSDEFNGTELDKSKWVDRIFYRLGDVPARDLPDNVVFKDGCVNLYAKYDPSFMGGRLKPRGPEFHSFTTGSIFSRGHLRYGYLEVRAKMHKSSFSSCFWLIGGGVRRSDGWESSPEIDVYELAGKSFAHTYSYCMAVHDIVRKGTPFTSKGKIWKSNFNFTDEFHVYGLEWHPKYIAWYVDGHLVRKLNHRKEGDNHWDIGMNINICTETQFGWFGIPETSDLPSVYSIDYLRVWKNDETTMKDDWLKKYENRHVMHPYGFAFQYYEKNGTKFVPGENTGDEQFESVNTGAMKPEAVGSWKCQAGAKVSAAKDGITFEFPVTMSMRDNGTVQYANAGSDWPQALTDQPGLASWEGYHFMAIDYENHGPDVMAVNFIYERENGAVASSEIIMKVGKGIAYVGIGGNTGIKKVGFGIRGNSKVRTFTVTGLRLQK